MGKAIETRPRLKTESILLWIEKKLDETLVQFCVSDLNGRHWWPVR